jgi:diguanylate cyclase (GGDEF)-like protein
VVFLAPRPPAGILLAIAKECLPASRVRSLSTKVFGVTLLILICATLTVVILLHGVLPVLDVKGNYSRITTTGVAPALQLFTALTLIAHWRITRLQTVLQLWLAVGLFALLCDNAITMLGEQRLSVGWYVGRLNGLISAAVMLFVYLAEMNRALFVSVNQTKELAVSYSQLETKVDQARVDQLTGLPGRALFFEQAETLIDKNALRRLATAVLFVDLDGFKHVNDKYGHGQGDLVLAQTATILRSSLRDGDIAGRFGGDEFVVCVSTPSDILEETAKRVAERIVSKVSEIGMGVGCSVGIALTKSDEPDLQQTIQRADDAMYRAKRRGKNRYVVHSRARLVTVA